MSDIKELFEKNFEALLKKKNSNTLNSGYSEKQGTEIFPRFKRFLVLSGQNYMRNPCKGPRFCLVLSGISH